MVDLLQRALPPAQRRRAPAEHEIGEWLACAPAIALIPLVMPGPAVSAQTPIPRVAFAKPSAANAAVCSWRTSTIPIPSVLQPSYMEKMWPPESVKSLLTPWAFRRRATSLPPWKLSAEAMLSVSVAAAIAPATLTKAGKRADARGGTRTHKPSQGDAF